MTEKGKADQQEDVVELLLGQHMRIRDLFDEVHAETGQRRKDAFERLVRLLAVHETAEEIVVHPLARRVLDGGEGLVDDRLAEEKHAKELLSRLESMGPDHEEFGSLLEQLRDDVLRHAHHEEQYEFPSLRQSCDGDQTRSMATLVRAAEKLAPTHPHPGTNSVLANLILGPGLALFDRMKDAVRKAISSAR